MFERWSKAMQTHVERVFLIVAGALIIAASTYYLYLELDWKGVATAAFLVLGLGTMLIASHHTVPNTGEGGYTV